MTDQNTFPSADSESPSIVVAADVAAETEVLPLTRVDDITNEDRRNFLGLRVSVG